jgi:hypothetical protein
MVRLRLLKRMFIFLSQGCQMFYVVSFLSQGCQMFYVVSFLSQGCQMLYVVSFLSQGCQMLVVVSFLSQGCQMFYVFFSYLRVAKCWQVHLLQRADQDLPGGGRELSLLHHRPQRE